MNKNSRKSIDWQTWIHRWDKMQERYIVRRTERFQEVLRLIKAAQPQVKRIIDLGCGTGSLMHVLLAAFPKASVFGIDFDPTMLSLASARLNRFGKRAQVALLDVRTKSWIKNIHAPVDAVVSATALHWLKPQELAQTYGQVKKVLKPGGIFLNADHVGSQSGKIQKMWETHRQVMRKAEGNSQNENWESFWQAYTRALGTGATNIRQRVLGGWEKGVEEGLSLSWHFDVLRKKGFTHVECFWRSDCDAIYGGIV